MVEASLNAIFHLMKERPTCAPFYKDVCALCLVDARCSWLYTSVVTRLVCQGLRTVLMSRFSSSGRLKSVAFR